MVRAYLGDPLQQRLEFDFPLEMKAGQVLPAGHESFMFIQRARQFDMSAFDAFYRADGRGHPPYDPRMMVALTLYCRSLGFHGGDQVARACVSDLGARLITGNTLVSARTATRFIDNHGAAIRGLLPQTLRLGHPDGLVDLSVIAGDGTYLTANAAMSANTEEADLLREIADLQEQLAAAEIDGLFEDIAAPGSLFDTPDPPAPDPPAPDQRLVAKTRKQIQRLATMLRSRRAALNHLRTHPNTELNDWTEKLQRDQERVHQRTRHLAEATADAQTKLDRRRRAEAAGKGYPGTKLDSVEEYSAVRKARKSLATAITRAETTTANRPTTTRVNTTDPTSRIMPGKHDGFDQRHNVQALCCKNQFILAIGTHDSPNDKQALVNLIMKGRSNLDAAGITDLIGTALFDSGYASEANFTTDLPITTLLVSVEREARQTDRLHDDTSTAPAAWQTMTDLLTDPDNRRTYKQRSPIIEPLFAQLFARFGRHLNARGANVTTELHLWAVTHNLLKISRHRKTRAD
jgi:transposase